MQSAYHLTIDQGYLCEHCMTVGAYKSKDGISRMIFDPLSTSMSCY